MDFSPLQQRAVDAVKAWLAAPDRKPFFYLAGYAGSGKTTLAKHLATNAGRVGFAAFTGKATLVLTRKGCVGARTIHSLIYTPMEKSRLNLHEMEDLLIKARAEEDAVLVRDLETKIRAEKEHLRKPSFQLNLKSDLKYMDLLVVDEVSMVGSQMGADLLSYETPILALGDPAQLPPVADGGFFTSHEPDFLLDEVHRQAAGSPILALATEVRKTGVIHPCDHGTACRVIAGKGFDIQDARAFDQVLVGRNATRKRFNYRYRTEVLGIKSTLPVTGDRLVCLRNNAEQGLLNGSLWNVVECMVVDDDQIALTLSDQDSDRTVSTIAWRHTFEDREKELSPWAWKEADSFDFGYALTVHKAQGSGWPKVLLLDEGSCFRDDARRWRYTGITRAEQELLVLKT